MELKAGYKQTEVGLIPKDWEVVPLERIGDPQRPISYGIVQTGCPVNNGVRCVRVVDIIEGRVNADHLITTSEEISSSYRRTVLQEDDLVVALRGKIGAVALVERDLVGANLTRGVALISGSNGYCSAYLLYYLSSPISKRIFERGLNGSALQEIPIATLRRIPAVLPPLPEQQAIAAVLGDVDALIGSLDLLIAKKLDLKQVAMQQLLTGQTRLPGFTGEWEMKLLQEGISLFSGHHVLAQHCNVEGRGVPYLTGPADFPGGMIRHTKYTENPTTMCRKEDILVTVKGSGSGSLVMADESYCISRQLMAIRVNDWDVRFLYYALLRDVPQIESASTGLIPGLSRSDLLKKLLFVPQPKEQAAIAEVLSDMDAEIAALENRRDKTRLLKQGMMQELLTGRTRLV